MRIKVLVTVGSMSVGGNEVFVLNLINHIDRKKFDVDVLVYSDIGIASSYIENIKESGSKIFFAHETSGSMSSIIKSIIYTRKVLIKGKYEIIHCNSCSLIGLIKGIISAHNVKHVKVVTHSHNSGIEKNTLIDKFCRKILIRFISNHADYGIACSDVAGVSKYTKAFINSTRYRVINNAVDVSRYLYNEDIRLSLRKQYNLSDEVIVLGNIGRLDYQKNQQFLLQIIKALKEHRCNVRLISIGIGENENMLRKMAETLGISENVIWLGERFDANLFYNAMDVFVMTSKYEGFPFVLTEAQINGLNCVVSDVISRNVNVTGSVRFLSLNDTPEAWANCIKESSTRRIPYEKRKIIIDRYNIKNEIVEIEKIYKSMVDGM